MTPAVLLSEFQKKTVNHLRTWYHRPRQARVHVSRLLLGGECGCSAAGMSARTGNVMRPSTRMDSSPHVLLLESYKRLGRSVLASGRFEQTAYFQNGSACIEYFGDYFGVRRTEGLVQVASDFIDRFEGRIAGSGGIAGRSGHTPVGEPVRVRPIRYSDCFEIVDGHHRTAIAIARGETELPVQSEGPSVLTPLQSMLLDVQWNMGRRELYQPIDAPELTGEWRLVRRCADRLKMMREFLEGRAILQNGGSYLDIAAFHGWFVAAFDKMGFDSLGVERDPIAIQVGRAMYGLDASRMIRSDCVQFLEKCNRKFDVVSCLSLLHHFVLGKGAVSAEGLVRMIDRITERVLFFDTGQSTERWFQTSLAEWTPDYIEEWLRRNTSFSEIIRVGTDEDRRAPYEENYGRTLFACVRKS